MGDIWPILWNLLEIILQNIINIDKIVIFLVQQCFQSSIKILVLIIIDTKNMLLRSPSPTQGKISELDQRNE